MKKTVLNNYKIYVNGMYTGVALFATDEIQTIERDFEIKLVLIENENK